MSRSKLNLSTAGALPAILLLLAFSPAGASGTPDDGEVRVTRNSYYAREGREQATPDRISVDEMQPGSASGSAKAGNAALVSGARSTSPNTEFWFYSVDVELFADQDLDGYHYGIDLLFDADTVWDSADVYAVLYLSREGGPWYEYARTDVFPIYGATSDDDFLVVSELMSGYPTGSYDILIELYDTWDGAFVADIGPESSVELSYLPLEDAGRDEPYVPPDVIVVDNGGGAADLPALVTLAVFLALVAARRRARACARRVVGSSRGRRA